MIDALASRFSLGYKYLLPFVFAFAFSSSSLRICDFLYSLFSFIFPPTYNNSHILLAMEIESWEVLVHKKQLEDAAKIPNAWRISEELAKISQTSGMNVLDIPRQSGILSARQLEITEKYDATDLLAKIHCQELSAYEVTEAFCIRAAIAQQVVCVDMTFLLSAFQTFSHRLTMN